MTTAVRLLSVAEIAANYRVQPSYVYRLAYLHHWRRIRLDGRVYYDIADADRHLGRD